MFLLIKCTSIDIPEIQTTSISAHCQHLAQGSVVLDDYACNLTLTVRWLCLFGSVTAFHLLLYLCCSRFFNLPAWLFLPLVLLCPLDATARLQKVSSFTLCLVFTPRGQRSINIRECFLGYCRLADNMRIREVVCVMLWWEIHWNIERLQKFSKLSICADIRLCSITQ